MDSAIFTLMILLTAAGADGTKVMVSIPEGQFRTQHVRGFYSVPGSQQREKRSLLTIDDTCLEVIRCRVV